MTTLPDPSLPWPIPMAGVGLIADKEGLFLVAYLCPASVPTIGRGHTAGVRLGDRCTVEQADRWMLEDVTQSANEVLAACTVTPSPNELAALTSFAFNCAGWKASSVIKAHNAGNREAAARAFALWNKSRVNGVLQVLPGLTTRRAAESALYLTPEVGQPSAPMPQAVTPEPAIAASPTVVTSSTGLAAGALALVSQAGDTVAPIKASVATVREFAADTLGIPTGWVLPGLLVLICGTVLWRRYGQRIRGVA